MLHCKSTSRSQRSWREEVIVKVCSERAFSPTAKGNPRKIGKVYCTRCFVEREEALLFKVRKGDNGQLERMTKKEEGSEVGKVGRLRGVFELGEV